MIRTAVAAGYLVAALTVCGCSNRQGPDAAATAVPSGSHSTLPDSAFLSILRSMSPAQRQAFAGQHPDQVSQIMQGPNPTHRTEFTLLMQAK